MTAVVALLSGDPDREEVVLAFNRCISESAVNARFLADKDEDGFFDRFVEFSLGPERELYDLIISNVATKEDQILLIESRTLEFIDRVCNLSGSKIENVRPKYSDWAGGLRNRLEALGQAEKFVALGRVLSHAVHGTWVDLILNHLREKDGGFAPEPSWSRVDSRLMLPVCAVVLESAYSYVRRFLGEHPELNSLYERVADLQARIGKVDQAHEAWIETRGQGTA